MDKDVFCSLELMVSKGGGEKVPFVVMLHRPKPFDDNRDYYMDVMCVVDGVEKFSMRMGGIHAFQAVCMGMKLVQIEIECLLVGEGWAFYREVVVEGGSEFCEVGLGDLFAYAV